MQDVHAPPGEDAPFAVGGLGERKSVKGVLRNTIWDPDSVITVQRVSAGYPVAVEAQLSGARGSAGPPPPPMPIALRGAASAAGDPPSLSSLSNIPSLGGAGHSPCHRKCIIGHVGPSRWFRRSVAASRGYEHAACRRGAGGTSCMGVFVLACGGGNNRLRCMAVVWMRVKGRRAVLHGGTPDP